MYGIFKDYDELENEIKNTLSEKRFKHSQGVAHVAIELAKLNGIDEEKTKVAAILHDCVKELKGEARDEFCHENNIDIGYLEDYHSIIHSHLGYHYAKIKYKIEDEDILNAIKYHTSGRANMSKLEEIIYLADFLDPNRNSEGYKDTFNRAKEYSYENLEKGMKFVLEKTISFLDGKKIYKDTLDAYKYYTEKY